MKFDLNSTVVVTPKADDIFNYEFVGTVIDYVEESDTYVVRDQDDDVFEVDADQLTAAHTTYTIYRFYIDRSRELIAIGLTHEEAVTHCQRDDTSGEGWFDGFEKE